MYSELYFTIYYNYFRVFSFAVIPCKFNLNPTLKYVCVSVRPCLYFGKKYRITAKFEYVVTVDNSLFFI